jgi:hypothetical protein
MSTLQTTQDVEYYTLSSPNLSKPCISCTFEFLISATPYLQTHHLGAFPSVGVAVKHRHAPRPLIHPPDDRTWHTPVPSLTWPQTPKWEAPRVAALSGPIKWHDRQETRRPRERGGDGMVKKKSRRQSFNFYHNSYW